MPGTFAKGAASTARLLLAPLGKRAASFHQSMHNQDRLNEGLILVLPGIDGCTTVCDNIARGLDAAGTDSAVEVYDWRSFRGWNPLHLATIRKNKQQAHNISQRLQQYRCEFPGRPISLIGHSAGAGIALFVMKTLPKSFIVDHVILLAAAVSRRFEANQLAESTCGGIWNFSSRRDLPTVGLGTLIFGTVDRRHAVSAGALGFAPVASESGKTSMLREVRYSPGMARSWNFGGHFGCTNAAFVERYVAPIINRRPDSPADRNPLSRMIS